MLNKTVTTDIFKAKKGNLVTVTLKKQLVMAQNSTVRIVAV